ncbi:MAG: hypothetical protein PQJ58_12135 [Spirochaetales bacterium]|nr:hypothetical protein [Spirochaetales bacterium]
MKYTAFTCLLFLITSSVFSQSPLADPFIPDNERISYSITTGKETTHALQTVSREATEDGRFWYKVVLSSPEQDIEVDILTETLIPYRSRKVQKTGRTEYTTWSEIQVAPAVKDDEILLVDFNDLSHILRGYPFSEPRTLNLVFPYNPENNGDKKDSISFRVKYIKEENLEIGNQSYMAHKLQLAFKMTGGLALFSGMVPKTFFWYSVENPHYLLKYEGSSGMGNSEKIIMEIESYEIGG